VLFLNLHKPSLEGNLNFQNYYNKINAILKQSIYYGCEYDEQIRTKDSLTDFLYDDYELYNHDKAREQFKSVTYVFVDGPVNMPPWLPSLGDACLLVRNCIREKKKVYFNGWGHITAYFYLTTKFDKGYCIRRKG
jgi:hypothetical protein